MLTRIALIVAILAGLAVGGLNFTKIKEKVLTLQDNLKKQTERADTAEKDRDQFHKDLDKTTAELKQTKTTLEATTTELATTKKDLEKTATELATTKNTLEKTSEELKGTSQELSRFKGTGYTVEQIIAFGKENKRLTEALATSQFETTLLNQKKKELQNELDHYKHPDIEPPLPAKLIGKVLVADPKWNFVVLNLGQAQGVTPYCTLLVNRNGALVAKVQVTSVQQNQSIANVLPGWQLGEVLEGDSVIPANPSAS